MILKTIMARLARIIKKLRENSTMSVRMGMGIQRIITIFIIFLILCHLTACFWYLIASIEDFSEDTWVVRYGLEDSTALQVFNFFNYSFSNTLLECIGVLRL